MAVMTIPVTARLDEQVVDALDRAVTAGLAPTRAAVVARAVEEWLARHGEDAITESYRRRYQTPDTDHDDLIARLAAFSAAACLANDGH
jgi:Arc/MetJ-type ribon-helix-helix transcriptional regulator